MRLLEQSCELQHQIPQLCLWLAQEVELLERFEAGFPICLFLRKFVQLPAPFDDAGGPLRIPVLGLVLRWEPCSPDNCQYQIGKEFRQKKVTIRDKI